MRKTALISFIAVFGISSFSIAQQTKTGILTKTPSSTIDINGSIEQRYIEIKGAYTIAEDDHHVSFSGTSDATVTLPPKSATDDGAGDFRGRRYFVKNNSRSSILTLAAASGNNFRAGGFTADMATYQLRAGYLAVLTANGENGWDIDIVDISSERNWELDYTDLNGFINTSQNIAAGAGFTTINNCSITVSVPSAANATRVLLNFIGWGDVTVNNAATGSFRFRLQQTGTSSATYGSIMMSSWATSHDASSAGVRFNFPIAYSIENLAPGTYTFTLEARREGEMGPAPSRVAVWGVQSVGNVFVQN